MTVEEKQILHKAYRKYLRTQKHISGTHLNAIMSAAEEFLPELIRLYYMPSFENLYEEQLNLRELLLLAERIKRSDDIMAGPQGYACWTAVKGYAEFFADKHGLNVSDYLPQESDFPKPDEEIEFHEGSEYEIRGIRYERDQKARTQCVEYYKSLNRGICRCDICKMSFEEVYGEDIGKDFIEVHHLIPISERGGDYKVNPITDLIPLCSNCHAMVHKGMGKGVTIEKIRERLRG